MIRYTGSGGPLAAGRRRMITAAPDPRRPDWTSPAPYPRLGMVLMLALLLLLTCDSSAEGGTSDAVPAAEMVEDIRL